MNTFELVAERFWSKVNKASETCCWEWQASRNKDGYGIFQLRNRSRNAARVAFELTFGWEPRGECILHTCDNPGCVNPSHLFVGTQADNMKDMAKKGRGFNVPRGERAHMAKLSVSQIKEIRRLYAQGNISQESIARGFGVNQRNVSCIVRHVTWTHI